MENIGSECNFDTQLAIICPGFLSLSRVPIGRFAAWSATSQLLIVIFLGINILISRPIFEGPSAHNPYLKQAISPTPRFGARAMTRLSVPTLPSRAHPQDYGSSKQLPQITTNPKQRLRNLFSVIKTLKRPGGRIRYRQVSRKKPSPTLP